MLIAVDVIVTVVFAKFTLLSDTSNYQSTAKCTRIFWIHFTFLFASILYCYVRNINQQFNKNSESNYFLLV